VSYKSDLHHVEISNITGLAKFFPSLIILILSIGFLTAIYLNRFDYAIRGLIIGIPALLAAYSLRKIGTKTRLVHNITFFHTNKFLIWIFIMLYLFSIISINYSATRPWYYFIFIACLFCVVGLQIFSNCNYYLVLLEIIGLIINLTYGVVLKYPLYYAWTDTFGLISLSKITLLLGHTIPPDLDISYANFPLYHIYLAEISTILGLDIQTILFIIMIIPVAFTVFFIFKIFNHINHNLQLTLLTCLLYSTLSVVIFAETSIQPRVMAYIGFIILLYVFFKGAESDDQQLSYRVIFLIVVAYLILVHQVSIFLIIILVSALLIIERIVSEKRIVKIEIFTTIFVITFSYWMYGASDFFHLLFSSRLSAIAIENITLVKPTVQVGNEWYFVFLNLDKAILIFFVLLGIGYLLRSSETKNYFYMLALFGLIMLPFFIPNPLQIFWTSMILFRADRLMLLLAPFFAALMAWGIYVHLTLSRDRYTSRKRILGFFLLVIFSFSLTSIVLTNADDSKDIIWGGEKKFFDQGEVDGLKYITSYVPLNSTITSDYIVNRYINTYRWFSESNEIDRPYYRFASLDFSGSKIGGTDYLLIRKKELINKGLEVETSLEGNYDRVNYNQEVQNKVDLISDAENLIYNSQNIMIISAIK
jgi:hypothetical protein